MQVPCERRFLRLARRTDNDEARLQAHWPARVRLGAGEREKLYAALPYVFVDRAPEDPGGRLPSLALACKLHRNATLLRFSPGRTSERYACVATRVIAQYHEIYGILMRAFGVDGSIWPALRDIESRMIWALDEEEALSCGRRDLHELTEHDVSAVSRAKGGSLMLALAGLRQDQPEEDAFEALSASVESYAEAIDALTHLLSWKSDLRARRPTLVVCRLVQAVPEGYCTTDEAYIARLGRALYGAGVARDIIEHVITLCDLAISVATEVIPRAHWIAFVHQLRQRAQTIRSELDAHATRNAS